MTAYHDEDENLSPAPVADAKGGDAALHYAQALAAVLHAKHHSHVTEWKPLPDLLGLLTQIDNMTVGLARSADNAVEGDDEAYEIGKRDGYEQAVQDIDVLTGGDGEYRFCTDGDPDRHTPDAAAMKQRIADRFAALSATPSPKAGETEWTQADRKAMAYELCSHRGETPHQTDRGGVEKWESYLPLADAALALAGRLARIRSAIE